MVDKVVVQRLRAKEGGREEEKDRPEISAAWCARLHDKKDWVFVAVTASTNRFDPASPTNRHASLASDRRPWIEFREFATGDRCRGRGMGILIDRELTGRNFD
jgi:hypothetical protein